MGLSIAVIAGQVGAPLPRAVEFVLRCDSGPACAEFFRGANDYLAFRSAASALGWSHGGGMSFCPKCRAALERPRRRQADLFAGVA